MATPFVRTNGTIPKIDFGTPLGGVISMVAPDSINDGTIILPPESCGLQGVIFQQLDDKVVANTTDETSQLGTGGSSRTATIKANSVAAGDCYMIRLNGFISCVGNPANTLKVKIGAVELVVSGPTAIQPNLVKAFVETVFFFTVRSVGATGEVIGQGHTKLVVGSLGSAYSRQLVMDTPATIDFTVDNDIDITYTWGAADPGNILTITNAMITVAR